jgi:hypothetical protein
MLHCSIITGASLFVPCVSTQPNPNMINVFLAIVPLGLATGALVWTMSSGAREQQRSDKWAKQWMRDNT